MKNQTEQKLYKSSSKNRKKTYKHGFKKKTHLAEKEIQENKERKTYTGSDQKFKVKPTVKKTTTTFQKIKKRKLQILQKNYEKTC